MKKRFILGGVGAVVLLLSLLAVKAKTLDSSGIFQIMKRPAPPLEETLKTVVSSLQKNMETYHSMFMADTMHGVARPSAKCEYQPPEDAFYQAEFADVIKNDYIQPGQHAEVKVYIKNTGKVRWYGEASGCQDKNFMHLGTSASLDRPSEFYEYLEDGDNGWLANNRIKMLQEYVDPEETATFSFLIKAPEQEAAYLEYFSPVIENVTWLTDLKVYLKFYVGVVSETDINSLKFALNTVNSSQIKPEDRWIGIDLSEQQMSIGAGDLTLRSFPVSTGKRATPTPIGNFSVLFKQQVRVAATGTPYIMPRWQAFTWLGHGLHALPSLSYDGGYFWTEARNHIGIPVSHGCVRLLPEDAEMLFEFTIVGTPVNIYW